MSRPLRRWVALASLLIHLQPQCQAAVTTSASSVPASAPCPSTAGLREQFRSGADLLKQEQWARAAKAFEALMSQPGGAAAAIYAGYARAKLAEFDTVRQHLELAKTYTTCLTDDERRKLTWMVDAYNRYASNPYGASGGTLSRGAPEVPGTTEGDIEDHYSKELSHCSAIAGIGARRGQESLQACHARAIAARRDALNLLRLSDPCGVKSARSSANVEFIQACVEEHRSRDLGRYKPLSGELP